MVTIPFSRILSASLISHFSSIRFICISYLRYWTLEDLAQPLAARALFLYALLHTHCGRRPDTFHTRTRDLRAVPYNALDATHTEAECVVPLPLWVDGFAPYPSL